MRNLSPVTGFTPVYRRDEPNRCPGCGRMHWWIGRVSAECGFCATALPLADSTTGAGLFRRAQLEGVG